VNFLRSTPAHSPATDDNDPETNVRLVLFTNTMPRFALLSNYDIASTSDDALAALHDPGFDPRTTVVLESPPIPAPAAELRHGTVEVLDQSTDHATLRVELSDPAILLVTDSYAEGWRATPVGDAPQERYDVLPANYGIPLTAGTHTFRMDYAPAAYRYGRLATLFSFGIFLGLVALWVVNRYEHGPVRKHKNIAAGPPD